MRNVFKAFLAMAIIGLKKAGGILDSKLEFSDAQAVTTATTTAHLKSTNFIDIGDAYQQPARGEPLFLNVNMSTALPAGTTLFYVYLNHSTDNSTWTSVGLLAQRAFSALATIGASACRIALPSTDLNRYLQLTFAPSAGTITAGAVNAWIGLDAPRSRTDTVQYGFAG
jgi:hypothetical protein